jgi:hypothetical protein
MDELRFLERAYLDASLAGHVGVEGRITLGSSGSSDSAFTAHFQIWEGGQRVEIGWWFVTGQIPQPSTLDSPWVLIAEVPGVNKSPDWLIDALDRAGIPVLPLPSPRYAEGTSLRYGVPQLHAPSARAILAEDRPGAVQVSVIP